MGGQGLGKEGVEGFEPEIANPIGLALYIDDVIDRVACEAAAGVECMALGIDEISDAAVDIDSFSRHNCKRRASGHGRFLQFFNFIDDPIIAPLLESEREILAAGAHDAAPHHDVDHVRHDVIQQPLVCVMSRMRGSARAGCLTPRANDFQRVDIQAAVGLVQDGVARLEHGHLQNFPFRFFFAAGKAFVHRAGGEAAVNLDRSFFS